MPITSAAQIKLTTAKPYKIVFIRLVDPGSARGPVEMLISKRLLITSAFLNQVIANSYLGSPPGRIVAPTNQIRGLVPIGVQAKQR
jgi:hypothetical protein